MVAVLMLAAASALPVPPQPPASGLVSHADYPGGAVSRGEEGAGLLSLFVDPRGKALSCNVEQVFGNDFGKLVCAKAMRATFRPATDRDGKPAYGFISSIVSFWMPDRDKESAYPIKASPDLSLSVKPIPGLLTERRDVEVAVVVNGKGDIADCAATGDAPETRLVVAACAQLKAQWTGVQLEFPSGSPKDYVRALVVSFEPETARP